jgi:hypothetical protein
MRNFKTLQTMIAAGVFAAVSSAPVTAGPSAKFAAVYSDTPSLSSAAIINDATSDTVVDITTSGHTLATIKVPQQKELLVGLSAEIGLMTDTSVKGKNGGSAKAIAGSEAYVTIFAVPTDSYDPAVPPAIRALPGTVILSKRVQEQDATLGGVIESCTDALTVDTDGDGVADSGDGTIDVATDCIVTDEEIGLMQDTTAAHHFNFVLPDMTAGEYDIVAVFTTGANAEIDICTSIEECALYDPDGTVSGSSAATTAVVNQYLMTIQEVRAVKGRIAAIDVESQVCTIDGEEVECP